MTPGRILMLNDTARRLHAVDAAGTQPTVEEEAAWFRQRDGVTPMAPENLPLRRALAEGNASPRWVGHLAKPGRVPATCWPGRGSYGGRTGRCSGPCWWPGT